MLGDPRSACPPEQFPIGWHPPHPAPGKPPERPPVAGGRPGVGLADPSPPSPPPAPWFGGEGRGGGAAHTGAVRSKSAPALPQPESRAAVQHRAARTGDRRSVRAAGENRNRRRAPSPSSEIGATPDLRQSGRAQRPLFYPAFGGNSERKRRRGRQPSLIQIPQ